MDFDLISASVTTQINAYYDALGCIRAPRKAEKRLFACYSENEEDPQLHAELDQAIIKETVTELRCALQARLYKAAILKKQVKSLGLFKSPSSFAFLDNVNDATSAFGKAALLSGKAWAIVSPMMFTVINFDSDFEHTDGSFSGNLLGVRVMVDCYGPDRTPVIFGTDGAVTVRGGAAILYRPGRRGMTARFVTTHHFSVDPNKIYRLDVVS